MKLDESIKSSLSSVDSWKKIFSKRKMTWLNMASDSMAPLIPENSSILIKHIENKEKIGFGDVILFVDGNNLIAHRVLAVQLKRDRLLQCGDNIISPAFIPLDSVIGVVVKVKTLDRVTDLDNLSGNIINVAMGVGSLGILLVKKVWPKGGNIFNTVRLKFVKWYSK